MARPTGRRARSSILAGRSEPPAGAEGRFAAWAATSGTSTRGQEGGL